MSRVLFVCLGNICRSPTAEAVFAALADEADVKVMTDSAGTGDWHVGSMPYGPAIKAAASRGYDLTKLRARQTTPSDFNDFDLIIAMDRSNQQDLEALRPSGSNTPVHLFTRYASAAGTVDVPDPYYTRDFAGALDLIEAASRGLLEDLKS